MAKFGWFMFKIKAILLILLGLILSVGFLNPTFAKNENQVNLYFFWGDGCPHCANEKPFLEELKNKYSNLRIYDFEVWRNSENRDLLVEVGKKLNVDVRGVPFVVVGEKYFPGWYDKETTGKEIESAVRCAVENGCKDSVKSVIFPDGQTEEQQEEKDFDCSQEEKEKIPGKVNVPVLGELEIKNLSLPFLAVFLGFLDGFNPCAMWVLVLLITLLFGMKDRRRMWILGGVFIFASAFVYFLFMTAWLNILLFVGFIFWIRLIIGLVAIGGGIYNLKEFFTEKNPTCKVTGEEHKSKIFERMKNIIHKKHFVIALLGLVALAFSVNLVELVCSAGLPVVFTQILSLSELSFWQYYLYIFIYIFFFMLDDLIVFAIAMFTLKLTGVTTKYTRLSHLLGGIIMLILGVLIMFKPGWLSF